MQAMILAAGLGTRLRPFTNTTPKALVAIRQKPALYWQLRRLQKIGVTEFAINTHYLANQIESFVHQDPARETITLFPEPTLLDTGGGLLNTQGFWQPRPFFLYNVDVFCTADLVESYHVHEQQGNLVTLLTQDRPSPTKFLVDEQAYICGIHYDKTQDYRLLRKPEGSVEELSFSGIHVVAPRLFPLITETGKFSIIDCYLRLIQEDHPVRSFNIGEAYWKNVGTVEILQELENDWENHTQLRFCYE